MKAGGASGAHVGDNAYDPETGDYYVCSHYWTRGSVDPVGKDEPDRRGNVRHEQDWTVGRIPKPESRGYVTAYNMQTGQIVWADELPHQCYAEGTTVTKGGVVFAGTEKGEISAYNAANGAELWHFEIGAGAKHDLRV